MRLWLSWVLCAVVATAAVTVAAANEHWERIDAARSPGRLRGACAAFSSTFNSLILFGGVGDEEAYPDSLFTFSLATRAWIEHAGLVPRPSGRRWASLTLVGEETNVTANYILLGGGGFRNDEWFNSNAAELWMLELRLNATTRSIIPSWHLLNASTATNDVARLGPGPVSMQRAVNRDGKLYTFGGNRFDQTTPNLDDYKALDEFWELDVNVEDARATWREIPRTMDNKTWPAPRFAYGMALYNDAAANATRDQLLLYSGRRTGEKELADFWRFDFATEVWTLVNAAGMEPRQSTAFAVNNIMERAHAAFYLKPGSAGEIISFGGIAKVIESAAGYAYGTLNQILLSEYQRETKAVSCQELDAFWCSIADVTTVLVDSAPVGRYDFAWAVVPGNGDLLIFGGATFSGTQEVGLGDLWRLRMDKLAELNRTVAVKPAIGFADRKTNTDLTNTIYIMCAVLGLVLIIFSVLVFLRRRRMEAYFAQAANEAGGARQYAGVVGAKPEVVAALPTKRYGEMEDLEGQHGTCSICLAEFEPDSLVRVLACGHFFCVGCIDVWLSKHNSCALCKSIVDEEAEARRFGNAPPPPQAAATTTTVALPVEGEVEMVSLRSNTVVNSDEQREPSRQQQ